MKWYDKLYVGESIKGKESIIKWKINHNAGTLSIYVIALSSNPNNLLDMIPARELMQKGYPKKDLRIIGLAKGYDEGVEVITQIIQDTYQSTGTVNVSSYLRQTRGRIE